jgi:hypothetical protein
MNDQLIRSLRVFGGKCGGPNRYDDAADALLKSDQRIRELEAEVQRCEDCECSPTARVKELEAQLERCRAANVYDGNAHRRVSELEALQVWVEDKDGHCGWTDSGKALELLAQHFRRIEKLEAALEKLFNRVSFCAPHLVEADNNELGDECRLALRATSETPKLCATCGRPKGRDYPSCNDARHSQAETTVEHKPCRMRWGRQTCNLPVGHQGVHSFTTVEPL